MSRPELALSMLSGRAGPSFEGRAHRVGRALLPILGPSPPQTPVIPPELRTKKTRLEAMSPPSHLEQRGLRSAIVRDALAQFLAGEVDGIAHALAERVWVFWPGGGLGYHDGPDLGRELIARAGRPDLPLTLSEPRDYRWAELKAALPRGVAESLNDVLDLEQAEIHTALVSEADQALARLMVVSIIDQMGGVRLATLPLMALDDAHIESRRTRDREGLAAAEELVRRVVLGHFATLHAQAHTLVDPLWVRDRMLPRDQLLGIVREGEHRAHEVDTVFSGTWRLDLASLPKVVTRRVADDARKAIEAARRRPLSALDTFLTVTELSRFDPETRRTKRDREVACLVLKDEDDAGNTRRRVAGLFI